MMILRAFQAGCTGKQTGQTSLLISLKKIMKDSNYNRSKHPTRSEVIEYARYLHDNCSKKPDQHVIDHVKICDDCAVEVLNTYCDLYLNDERFDKLGKTEM